MEIDLSKNFLTIQFNENNNIVGEVALTDFTPVLLATRHRLPSTSLIKCPGLGRQLELKPFACTFTYANTKVVDKKPQTHVYKNGNSRTRYVDILLINLDPLQQWNQFKKDYYCFIDKFNRLGFHIMEYELYPEFTAQGLIHVHGLLWHDSEGWTPARAHLMAATWCKVSGARMVAQIKSNGHGHDYSFAQCNDIKAWHKYIKKEQTIHSLK